MLSVVSYLNTDYTGNTTYELVNSSVDAETLYESDPLNLTTGIGFEIPWTSSLQYTMRMPYDKVPSSDSLYTTTGKYVLILINAQGVN